MPIATELLERARSVGANLYQEVTQLWCSFTDLPARKVGTEAWRTTPGLPYEAHKLRSALYSALERQGIQVGNEVVVGVCFVEGGEVLPVGLIRGPVDSPKYPLGDGVYGYKQPISVEPLSLMWNPNLPQGVAHRYQVVFPGDPSQEPHLKVVTENDEIILKRRDPARFIETIWDNFEGTNIFRPPVSLTEQFIKDYRQLKLTEQEQREARAWHIYFKSGILDDRVDLSGIV